MKQIFFTLSLLGMCLATKAQSFFERAPAQGQIPSTKVKIHVRTSKPLNVGVITEKCSGTPFMKKQEVSKGIYYIKLDNCGCGDGKYCPKKLRIDTIGLGSYTINLEGGTEYILESIKDGKWIVQPMLDGS